MRRTRSLLVFLSLSLFVGLAGFENDHTPWARARADTYTIQAGDTLWEIANRLQVGLSVLLALNSDIDSPNNIYVGQSIRVPDNVAVEQTAAQSSSQPTAQPNGAAASNTESGEEDSEAGPTSTYVIREGDMLGVIADTLGTDVETLLALNPELRSKPNLLFVGSTIAVPSISESQQQQSLGSRQSLNAAIRVAEPAQPLRQTVEYVVEPGDSPLAIAESAGITLEELIEANPLTDFDAMIHPGDILYIPIPDHLAPALDPADAASALTARYTVRLGDIASSIARRHGISLARLTQLNGGANLNLIQPGQTLTVPWTGETLSAPPGTVPAVEVRQRTYRVVAGDTFNGIALSHGLTLEELRAVNDSLPRDLVFIGQLLYLPGTIDPPVVSEERTLWETDLVQYAAATLGVTPQTLIANHDWLDPDQWLGAGTSWRLPIREGILVTVQAGDTLRAIANRYGVEMDAILADPAYGVEDPNAIVIGQEIIVPLAVPDFVWPAQGELTDPFGLCRSWDCSYRHKGLDMALDFYAPIVAAADGVVTFVGGDALLGLGWYVEVDHGNGWLTVYAHLVEFGVWEGQTVSKGEIIGYNGSTGYSTGPHLHFEVQHNDWYVDPLVVLP